MMLQVALTFLSGVDTRMRTSPSFRALTSPVSLTMAYIVPSDFHSNAVPLASSGVTVTLSWRVSLGFRVTSSGVMARAITWGAVGSVMIS